MTLSDDQLFRATCFRTAYLFHMGCFVSLVVTLAVGTTDDAFGLTSLALLPIGTVELVGGGPDFLIAYADHPMMPPHNAFAHVVEVDMPILDKLVETKTLKVQNWGAINATVFAEQQLFYLRRL